MRTEARTGDARRRTEQPRPIRTTNGRDRLDDRRGTRARAPRGEHCGSPRRGDQGDPAPPGPALHESQRRVWRTRGAVAWPRRRETITGSARPRFAPEQPQSPAPRLALDRRAPNRFWETRKPRSWPPRSDPLLARPLQEDLPRGLARRTRDVGRRLRGPGPVGFASHDGA